jgi:hypothetical protein
MEVFVTPVYQVSGVMDVMVAIGPICARQRAGENIKKSRQARRNGPTIAPPNLPQVLRMGSILSGVWRRVLLEKRLVGIVAGWVEGCVTKEMNLW